MAAPSPPPTPPKKIARLPYPRSRRGWIILVGSSLFMLLLITWLLSRATPSWYHPLNPTETAVIDKAEHAQDKFLDLHNALQRTPLGDQRWTVTQDELNALLAVRFNAATPAPTDAVAPPLISAPFVRFTPGLVTVAARTTKVSACNANGGVVSASFVVESSTAPDGSPVGHVRLASTHVGNLPIPTSVVQNKIRALAPAIITAANQAITYQFGSKSGAKVPEIETAIHAIVDAEPFPLLFTYDRRKILVKEIRVADGSLSITFAPPTPAAVSPRPPR
jgi:hypothetical protein